MIVRPWEPGDTDRIELQEAQDVLRDHLSSVDLQPLSDAGLAMTAEVDGKIIAIAGLAPQWEGRAIAWALLSNHSGDHFVRINREVRRFLIKSGIRRIEATVDVGFTQGHRWLKILGFEPEGYMKAYRPDGGDQILYSRVRHYGIPSSDS